MSGTRRVAIIAPAKSGSTAVYNSVKKALETQGDVFSIFEPQTHDPLMKLRLARFKEQFVTKIMSARMVETKAYFHLDWFDSRIVLVRDIRDLIVSELLFRPMISPTTEYQYSSFVQMIKDKERNPNSISVVKMHEIANEMGVSYIDWTEFDHNLDNLIDVSTQFDVSVVKYEDYAAGDFGSLSSAIGDIDVEPVTLENSWVSHINRKGVAGDWKLWLTDEDLEFCGNRFENYNNRFEYDMSESLGSDRDSIDPTFGSAYIERRYTKRVSDFSAIGGEEPLTQKGFESLLSNARDGGVGAMKRIVALASSGELPQPIPEPELAKMSMFLRLLTDDAQINGLR